MCQMSTEEARDTGGRRYSPQSKTTAAEAILQRSRGGKRFSIVAVSEGAMSVEMASRWQKAHDKLSKAENKKAKRAEEENIRELEMERTDSTTKLTQRLEKLTVPYFFPCTEIVAAMYASNWENS